MITAVVWLCALDGGWYEGTPENGLPFVHQSALDAMTAERDALAEQAILRDGEIQVLKAQRNTLMERHKARVDERDSAREALAKACEVVREYLECDRLMQMDGCPDDRFSPALTALRALAAQPETKP